MNYESTCPRCGAMLLTGGCLSCGYPAGTLRERTAADTALAEKSKGDPQLGYVRIEALIEAFENLAFVRQQFADTKQQLEETKWECRNLEAERDEARRELAEAEEAIRALAWRRCPDCEGDGYTFHGNRLEKATSCESCGGHEDRCGDGWISDSVDNIAETMESPAVLRARERGKVAP